MDTEALADFSMPAEASASYSVQIVFCTLIPTNADALAGIAMPAKASVLMSTEALAQIYWLKIELNQYDLTTGFLRDGTRKGNDVQYHIYTIMIADALVGIVPKCPQELGFNIPRQESCQHERFARVRAAI